MFLATLIASQLLLVASEVATNNSPQDDEKMKNAVETKIYQYSVDAWNSEGSSVMSTAMVEKANKLCKSNHKECCLHKNWTTSSTEFTSSEYVGDFPGYPSFKRPYFTWKVAMKIPSGLSDYLDSSCVNTTYLKRATVIKLIESSRNTFSEKTDHYVTEIEEKRYPLPPNNLINYIMIPISIALVLVLVVLLIILMWKCGGPPEAVNKLEMTPSNSLTTTMTPTAVEVQMEAQANAPSVKPETQDAQTVENGNSKKAEDKIEENNTLINNKGQDTELNSQHNSGYDPAPTEENAGPIDEIEKELADIN